MANDILVYALHYEGAINKNSLGAISEGAKLASELGGECHALLVGEGVPDDLASTLGAYGATKVFRAEGPALAPPPGPPGGRKPPRPGGPGAPAPPVADPLDAVPPPTAPPGALLGGGLLGFETGPAPAARRNAGVVMEVVNVRVEDGR